MNLKESIRRILREENTLPNFIRRRFSEEELYKLVSNVERTFETHRISQQHREDVIDAEVDDFIMNSVYYGEFEDFDDEIYQDIYNLYREPLVDYIKSKIDMNLQESIRKILREETINLTTILRRVHLDELEREFEESLDITSNWFFRFIEKNGSIINLDRFINFAISSTIDGIHHDLYSTLPEDIQWYEDVKESLKDYYKDRIKTRYEKLISEL